MTGYMNGYIGDARESNMEYRIKCTQDERFKVEVVC